MEMIMSMSKEELQVYVLKNENEKLGKLYDAHEDKPLYDRLQAKIHHLSDFNTGIIAECPELDEHVKYNEVLDMYYKKIDRRLKEFENSEFLRLKTKMEANKRMIYELNLQIEKKKKQQEKKQEKEAKKGM